MARGDGAGAHRLRASTALCPCQAPGERICHEEFPSAAPAQPKTIAKHDCRAIAAWTPLRHAQSRAMPLHAR
eukprot:362104-Chlamydomonas_euryale.AAC.1